MDVWNGSLLQFWMNPDFGFSTIGSSSNGRYSVHSVSRVLPGTVPLQSWPAARSGSRALYA